MRVSVFGLGYVGCVTAACLARDGNVVVGLDANPQKMDRLAAGRPTVMEPGLQEIVEQAVRQGNLQVGEDAYCAVQETDVSMICVGTPSNGNGKVDLHYVEGVCHEIGEAMAGKSGHHTVVVRSTVVPGSTEGRFIPILQEASGGTAGQDFGVAMNPEFLREGSAIWDFDHPSYVVVGQYDERSGDDVQELYRATSAPVVRTALKTAEMLKYVNNAYHALKITFANEIGNLCKAQGIDGQEVMDLFCRDQQLNLSPAYLKPGFAFGGSCLPKDLRALLYRAKELDLECPVLSAIWPSNQRQIQYAIELVEGKGKTRVGVLGLSFKAGTDDVRESSVVPLIETLAGRGYEVSVYDEKVDPANLFGANRAFLERQLPHIAAHMRASIEEVMAEAEVIVVANGAKAFRHVPALLRDDQVLIDLVGIGRENGATRGVYEGICW